MNEPIQVSQKALFRYSVVSKVLSSIAAGDSQAEAIQSVSEDLHSLFDGAMTRVSPRSLYRWLAAYRATDLAGLEPGANVKALTSSALSTKLLDFLVKEKARDCEASIPELIRRATETGVLKQSETVDRSTVYRACKRLALPLARRRHAGDRDSRRFAHAHRMDMVLCDGKHFRVGDQRRKRVALFFLDDATRRVLAVVVGTAGETKTLFLRGLYECIHKFGLMTTMFVDNGPGFIALDSATVFARLGILLIHGEKRYKEGHGKIERFNRTIKADVLRGLDGSPDVDSDCGALELRLRHYIETIYACRPHAGLDGDTPEQRFKHDPKALRFPLTDQELRQSFEVTVERRVANDHVVSVDGTFYEVPRGYAGRKITLRHRLLEATIVFWHDGKTIELHPVDLAANARAKRAKDLSSQPSSDTSAPPTTAADLAFQSHFESVVDEDGGFIDDDDDTTTDFQQDQDHSDQEKTS
jgi:transposase InsO family protein